MLESIDLVVGKKIRCIFTGPNYGKTAVITKVTHNSGSVDGNEFDVVWDDKSGDDTTGWGKLSSFELAEDEDQEMAPQPSLIQPEEPPLVPGVCQLHYYGVGPCNCHADKQKMGQNPS